ncbi:hypothetical protein [Streptomyces sp. NPDC059909]|uniref:hypothetical protein n=1 Tax=Streptomyces sp. NPDC059909 TaxID=3346998 RepID=UPI0036680641
MAVVTNDDSAQMLSRRYSTDVTTLGSLRSSLRRSLAHEAVTDELYDDLEAVLGAYSRPASIEVSAIAWGGLASVPTPRL